MRHYLLLILLSALFTTSCKTKPAKQELVANSNTHNPVPFDTNKYNLEIIPDTTIKCLILTGRPVDTILENKPYYVDTNFKYRLLSQLGLNHRYKSLWPCNLPDLIKPGDSVLVSGILYAVAGDERMPGIPTMITNIRLHDSYKKGEGITNKR